MPKEMEKVVNKAMDKAIKQIDEKISEIKMFCLAITLFLIGLQSMVFFMFNWNRKKEKLLKVAQQYELHHLFFFVKLCFFSII